MGLHRRNWKKTSKAIGVSAGLTAGAAGAVQALRHQRKPVSRAVIMLGSGRSGTSVLAQSMEHIGVDLGSNLISGNATNPKGFFEDRKIVMTHKQIHVGKRPFEKGWQKRKSIKPYKDDLKSYIQDNFLHKPLWGWKDPRTNDFLDLWQDILQELRVEPHYVIMVRNPVDVVASSKRAYNRDEIWARLQWQLRTLSALYQSYGSKRIIVTYDELFHDPLECLRTIATQLQLSWPEDEVALQKKLDSFIDPSLQKSSSEDDEQAFAKNPDFPQDAKKLYNLCLDGAQDQDWLQSEEYQAQVEQLYQAYLEQYGKLSRKPPRYTGQLP